MALKNPLKRSQGRPKRSISLADAHEFKPLLAEIEARPVSPLGRSVFWIVTALIVSTLVWAYLGRTDVVVSLRGRLVPQGESKTVQALETGVVREILAREGQRVKKGDPLLLLDPAQTDPALSAAQANLSQLSLDIARLQASAEGGAFSASGDRAQNALYQASIRAQAQRREAQQAEIRRIEASIESNRVEQAQTRATLQAYQTREQRMAQVLDIIPKDDYLRAQDEISRLQSRLQALAHDQDGLREQKRQMESQIQLATSQFREQALSELTEKRKQANDLLARLQDTAFRRARQTVVSPVDGLVERVMTHTAGEVVTPAQPLATILPADAPLLVEATAQNRDVGFIRPGMRAALKIDAFDFQKYGMLAARVTRVSEDSQPLPLKSGTLPLRGGDSPESGEAVYRVQLAPLQRILRVDGREEPLSAGMTATVDVKTGERRLIEFFLYPLLRRFNEGVSVR